MLLSLVSLLLFIIIHIIFASYCGEDAIPFSLQALQNGQPVLGCARPSCFGWGVKTDRGARFYRIHKKSDGFMRSNDRKKNNKEKIMAREAQLAFCEKSYVSSSCDENTQWVGGLSPSTNITAKPLFLQCCKFDKLKNSWDRGIAEVGPGQIVIGGEVMHGERQYAFDYIANVKKYFKKNGSLAYGVTIRRFWCLPHPTKSDLYVEKDMLRYVVDRMGGNYEPNNKERKNFGQYPSKFDEKMIASANFPTSQTFSSDSVLLNSQSIGRGSGVTNTKFASKVFQQVSPQYQSMVSVSDNRYLDASALKPGQFVAATAPQTQQLLQQPVPVQQQSQQSGTQSFHPSSQPQAQHHHQFLHDQQVQQSAVPQSSLYPSFPSFDQFAFSVS